MKKTIIYCPVAKGNVEMIDWGKYRAYAACSFCGQYPNNTGHVIVEKGDFYLMNEELERAHSKGESIGVVGPIIAEIAVLPSTSPKG